MSPPDLSSLRIERRPAPSRGGRGWLLAVVLLIGTGAAVAWVRANDRGPVVAVGRVRKVGGAETRAGVSANGYVVARRRAALSTDIQGRIVELRVEEGQRVKTGDLIARLDTSQLEASRARARADLAGSRVAAARAAREVARLEPLLRSGYSTPSDLDRAREEAERQAAAVAASEAQVREVEIMIRKSSVFAPFDGVVTQKNAEVGEVVSAMTGAGPNARGSVATLVDFDTLEVQVELAQTALAGVELGAPARVYLDAWPEQAYRGRVRQIWPQADRQKATVELRVALEERDERLRPEMGARVVLVAQTGTEATAEPEVLVPEAAVVSDGGSHVFVFLPGGDELSGRVERRAVVLGPAGAGRTPAGTARVERGLEGGEWVVLSPPAGLKDGGQARRRQEGS